MKSVAPIVVVGGGTAGSTVVSYLAGHTTSEIVLVDPGAFAETDDVSRFHDVLATEFSVRHQQVSLTSARSMDYLSSWLMGGGSAVNGLLLTGEVPKHLEGLTRPSTAADIGTLGKALLVAGGEFTNLWWNRGRWNPGRAVRHLEEEGRIRIVRGEALSVEWRHGAASGVRTMSEEIAASHVVLCAGAIETPSLLLKSGCQSFNAKVGQGLQNHPSVSVPVARTSPSHARFDAAVVRRIVRGDTSLMMFAFERASTIDEMVGLFTVALMSPSSRGTVTQHPDRIAVDFNILDTPDDRRALIHGVDELSQLSSACRLSDGVARVLPMRSGDVLSEFPRMSQPEREEWVANNVEMLFHASSSCSQAVDNGGRLLGVNGVHIADASILSRVPIDTPAGPVTMEALRIARQLGEELA